MDLDKLKDNPEQIKALIDILSSLLPSNTDKNDDEDEDIASNTIKTRKTKTKGKKINLFDKMPEKNQHKEDSLIDKKLCVAPPTERTREFEFIELACRCCGKKEKCNPALVLDKTRYKCNKCCTSAG